MYCELDAQDAVPLNGADSRGKKTGISISRVEVTRPSANGNLNAQCSWIESKSLLKLATADAAV
jgi:hypothetical protein